ncbi:MAG TPA: CHAT domain-containing protein [Archangium sp.]|nr:CHAT domain-containing protein [Archangium sp.]
MSERAPTPGQVVERSTPDTEAALEPVAPVSAPEPPPGVETSAPERTIQERVSALDTTPPPELALVHIQARGEAFVIHAFEGGRGQELASDTLTDNPFESGLDAESFFGLIDLLNDTPALQKFVGWVEKQLKTHPGLHLAIQEHKSANVPWEMLKLPDDDSFLGARVNVARWEGKEEEGAAALTELGQAKSCEGEVLAYVAPGLLEDMRLEPWDRQALEGALQTIHRGNPLRKMEELLVELEKEHPGVGMVYLLCHGLVTTDAKDFELGASSEKYPEDRLSLLKLRTKKLKRLRHSDSIIFLDACEGGQVMQGVKYLPAGTRVGFPQTFLKKGARGVIGALAAFELPHAAKLAQDLLELARKEPRTVPELLRELRARAAEGLEDETDPKRWERWYHTFLYVYYGHPLTTLSLGQGEAGHGG